MKLVSYLVLISSKKVSKNKGTEPKKTHKQLVKQLFMSFIFSF